MQILSLKSKKPLKEIELKLKTLGLTILYTIATDDINEICIEKPKAFNLSDFFFIEDVKEFTYTKVNWEAQAKEQLHFKAGYHQIDLNPYGKNDFLKLIPGPGFGNDLHPTTELMLQLMAPHIKNKKVLDIGSGSGILSLVAKALGAIEVMGVDIDSASNLHAAKNALLNNLSNVYFQHPLLFKGFKEKQGIILMNMIYTEQMSALKQLGPYLFEKGSIFTSGILKSQKDFYLNLIKPFGWQLKQQKALKGWLGFVFEK